MTLVELASLAASTNLLAGWQRQDARSCAPTAALRTGLLGLLVALPSAAGACIGPPPPVPFPGESDVLYQSRAKAGAEAIADEDTRSFQVSLRERSTASFLGIVATRRPIRVEQQYDGAAVTIRPVEAFSGTLPTAPLILRDARLTSCGMAGGGTATRAVVGEYVVVFLGVPLGSTAGRENYGLRAQDARDPILLAALNKYALNARDSGKVH